MVFRLELIPLLSNKEHEIPPRIAALFYRETPPHDCVVEVCCIIFDDINHYPQFMKNDKRYQCVRPSMYVYLDVAPRAGHTQVRG